MAITHATAARNAAADAVLNLIDAGASAGTLEFQTSGDVEVATLTFSDPAYAAAVAGVAQENAITNDTNATGGTIAKFRIFDSNSNEIINGTVTATGGGGDIELSTITVNPGDSVSVTDLPYTAPV